MSIRYIVVGLGNIGTRRRQVLGSHYVGGVDPLNREADWLAIDDVPPESYDAAVLSVPNQVKIDLLSRLLAMGKDVLNQR